MIRVKMYNQLTTFKNKMYNKLSKNLLAVASLALMTAAKIVKLTEDELHLMNETGE